MERSKVHSPICPICNIYNKEIVCQKCVNENNMKFYSEIQKYISKINQIQEDVKGNKYAKSINKKSNLIIEITEVEKKIQKLKKQIETCKEEISKKQKNNDNKKKKLSKSENQLNYTEKTVFFEYRKSLELFNKQNSLLKETRTPLIHELTKIFGIPLKEEQNLLNTYYILDHSFPPINEIKNYRPENINGSIQCIIQYVILLSRYLDVKLPFSLHYQGEGSYVECHFYKCTCYVSLHYSKKIIEEFLTGLSMLCYDIIYLCYTQNVILQEKNILNILECIYKCIKSPDLGHEITGRKVSFITLNDTLKNLYNLEFSRIIKLIFLNAEIQIPKKCFETLKDNIENNTSENKHKENFNYEVTDIDDEYLLKELPSSTNYDDFSINKYKTFTNVNEKTRKQRLIEFLSYVFNERFSYTDLGEFILINN
jgi:hypothetical protein